MCEAKLKHGKNLMMQIMPEGLKPLGFVMESHYQSKQVCLLDVALPCWTHHVCCIIFPILGINHGESSTLGILLGFE